MVGTSSACRTAPPKQAASVPCRWRNRPSAVVSFSIRSPTHVGCTTVSGRSNRPTPAGRSTAGAVAAALTRKPAQSHDGQIGEGPVPATRPATVAPIAATSTNPSIPNTRSIRITVVASVLDRAGRAVSRMRTTSPPILLGKKLLKKIATRYEDRSALRGDVNVLGAEKETPAPGARQRHHEVQRGATSIHGGTPAGAVPERARNESRNEEGGKGEAHAKREGEQRQAAPPRSAVVGSVHPRRRGVGSALHGRQRRGRRQRLD